MTLFFEALDMKHFCTDTAKIRGFIFEFLAKPAHGVVFDLQTVKFEVFKK
jgi:hypothetical protein